MKLWLHKQLQNLYYVYAGDFNECFVISIHDFWQIFGKLVPETPTKEPRP